MNRRRRAARAAGGRRAPARLRGRLDRADERHALAVAARRRPAPTARHVRPAPRGVRRADPRRCVEGGVDLLLIETIFDTLNAKAAIAAARDVARRAAAVGLVHDRSTAAGAPSPARRSRRSGRRRARRAADRRRQLLARRDGDAPVPRRPRPRRATCTSLLPERRPAERVRRLRRAARRHAAAASASSPRPGSSTSSAAAAARRRSTCAAIAARSRDWPRGVSRATHARPRFSGLEPFEIRPDTGFVMVGERTNVTGSARFRRLIEADDYQDARRGRARAGARRRQPPRREHGRRPARLRAGDDHVPQPARHRAGGRAAPGHGRQLALVGDRGRPQVHPGQGDRQLDQPQGGRGGVPREGARDPPLRRRRRRDGLRRAGPGGHRRAQGGDLRARLRPAHRARRLPARGHHLRPQHPRGRDRDRGARRLREGVHRVAAARSRSAARGAHVAAASPTSRSPSAATTPSARRCTRRSSTTRSRPGSTWGSSTPASSPSTRTSSRSCSSASRT